MPWRCWGTWEWVMVVIISFFQPMSRAKKKKSRRRATLLYQTPPPWGLWRHLPPPRLPGQTFLLRVPSESWVFPVLVLFSHSWRQHVSCVWPDRTASWLLLRHVIRKFTLENWETRWQRRLSYEGINVCDVRWQVAFNSFYIQSELLQYIIYCCK